MSKTIKNKLVFTTKDEDGKELKLAVRKPNLEEAKELQKIFNKAYRDALDSGAFLRIKLDEIVKQQGIWNDEKEKKFKGLQKELFESELKLLKGGSAGLTKLKAKELAIRMSGIRVEMQELMSGINSQDSVTADRQAENAKFEHSIYLCTINPDTGDKFYKNLEDFNDKKSTKATEDAMRNMALLTYNLDPEYESNLPENKFLKDYGFVNEKLRLINSKGELVDSNGKRTRDDGRYINEKNELVDLEGNLVDEKGNYIVEFTPFLEEQTEDISKKKA